MRSADHLRLPAGFHERLAKLLGMVGSDHGGEALNAARLANRLVRDAGITWPVLLTPVHRAPPTFDVLHNWPKRWRAAVHLCQTAPQTRLTPFERQFCANLARYKHKPSSPQLDVLATIVSNVVAKGGAK